MATKILFIFEGAKKEKSISDNLTQFFVNEHTLITCAYCTTIYKMYHEIAADEDLDTFSLLEEIPINKEPLKGFKRADFAQIYLFFDYDGHATNASDEKLKQLLAFFNEETDKGKLYISYPMVEALKHIENFDTFKDLKINYKVKDYKQIVNKNCIKDLIDFNVYNLDIWRQLVDVHLKKMNRIVNDFFEFPVAIIEQSTIFKNQLEKYIKIDQTVAVLSAFPVFLHDYYGNEKIRNRCHPVFF